jgi:hypothetical protein
VLLGNMAGAIAQPRQPGNQGGLPGCAWSNYPN